ncbi:MAG: NAD(P)/FAD-dependent oxidoreductase, partial [Myxococcales bacterium]|nr:NAD(P)/FAD-dependent oxidoreductase [Myxococcales bacterium]
MKNLVVLGAGTAGTMMANKLAERLDADWAITVVDRDDVHLYQPGLLFLPFGEYSETEIVKARSPFFPSRVKLDLSGITKVEADAKKVHLGSGETLSYDVLILATGSRLVPEQTEGLTGVGWHETAFDFYTLEGAMKLRQALDGFKEGRLLVNFVDLPIKCPVAPLEFVFLADAFFTRRGLRDRVDITYVTPLDAAFTKPRASQAFGSMMEQRNIALETSFAIEAVDGQKRVLRGYGDRELPYDLLVTVPLHSGSEAIVDSGLGDELGFVPTDKHTLQTEAYPEVFAIGDATNLPASKAGSVAHFQAEVLIENVMRFIDGRELDEGFDGHAN